MVPKNQLKKHKQMIKMKRMKTLRTRQQLNCERTTKFDYYHYSLLCGMKEDDDNDNVTRLGFFCWFSIKITGQILQ